MRKYLLALFSFFIFGFWFFWQGIYGTKNSALKDQIFFRIERGESSKTISRNLVKEGLIISDLAFVVYVLFSGDAKKIQAGVYELNSATNVPAIVQKFVAGDVAKRTVTIPEGFTQAQIEKRLGLELPDGSEGYLFPDTYHFPLPFDLTGEEAIRIMKDNFAKKTVGLEITSEIVVMASLLEKEVKTKEEKELASGILWKRLKIGMPLQVDAAMWTYQNRGLPPSPIANPGLESIEAAIFPKQSPYLYYLSTKEGKTIFSRTLTEHNIAKAKYLR